MVNDFTREDMVDLFKHLSDVDLKDSEGCLLNDSNRVLNLLEFFEFNADRMIKDSPLLLYVLTKPFNEMPLLINSDCYIDSILAKWRLKIGK